MCHRSRFFSAECFFLTHCSFPRRCKIEERAFTPVVADGSAASLWFHPGALPSSLGTCYREGTELCLTRCCRTGSASKLSAHGLTCLWGPWCCGCTTTMLSLELPPCPVSDQFCPKAVELGFHNSSRGKKTWLYTLPSVSGLDACGMEQRPCDTCSECSVKAYCVTPFLFAVCLMVALETMQAVLLKWDILQLELGTLGWAL